MKVYSLYCNDTFVVAFPNHEGAIQFGKKHYDEYSWECNIIEEYLSKSPLTYNPNPLTNPGPSIPFTHPPVITKHPDIYPFPDVYGGGVKVTYFAGPQGDIGITDYGLNGVQQ
jgi:hypothetical protein